MGVLGTRALLFGVYIRALHFPNSQIQPPNKDHKILIKAGWRLEATTFVVDGLFSRAAGFCMAVGVWTLVEAAGFWTLAVAAAFYCKLAWGVVQI